MTLQTLTTSLRLAAAAGLAVAGSLAAAAPAQAADPIPLKVVAHQPIALDASYDPAKPWVVVSRMSEGLEFTLTYDFSTLNDKLVTWKASGAAGCAATGAETIRCTYTHSGTDLLVHPKPPATLTRKGLAGAAGHVGITLDSDVPVDPTGETASVAVSVPAKGVDLLTLAQDVYALDSDGNITDDPVPPGDTSVVVAGFANGGDVTADGVKVTVRLPQYVTFAEAEPGCDYTADNRTVTCDYDDIVLAPIAADPDPADPADGVISAAGAYFPVTVAANAPGPTVLTGGTFTAAALAVTTSTDRTMLARGRASLPDGVKALDAATFADVNPADNTDEFAVHVGAAGGSGGGLPVTGAKAGLIGGVGAAALLAGGLLFLGARRRRVVFTR
ncbi:MAG TPA: hypothetical protein VES42_25560 [Pilimelia sp.]|nr:hypothetical protein [Pilimelia sp.]